MGGLLKGRTGLLGRTRLSVEELAAIGERTTRAALVTLEKLTRTPVETVSSEVFLGPMPRLGAHLAHHDGAGVVARFRFTGSATGVAGLALREEDAFRLAGLLLGRGAHDAGAFSELEESTIAETTNIALNGALTALTREEGVRIKPGVPEVRRRVSDVAAFLRPDEQAGHVVVVETAWREPTRGVDGSLLLLFALS